MTYDEAARLEQLKHSLALTLESRREAASQTLEQIKSETSRKAALTAGLFSYAGGTMSSLLLVNSGAVIAMLSLSGSLASHLLEPGVQARAIQKIMTRLTDSLSLFAVGAGCALFAFGMSYLSQLQFLESDRLAELWWRNAKFLRLVAIGFAILSLIAFVFGASEAGKSLRHFARGASHWP